MKSKTKPLVLVADDDLSIRFLVRETLEQEGFAVEEVEDGIQVLAAAKDIKPDLIMLDVVMPGIDGFEACSRIRTLEGGRDVPIIMMTGLDDLDSVKKAYGAGATDFITKPINWSLMSYRVQYVLRSSKAFADLKLSEARLAEAQSIAKLGNWEIDMRTGVTYWSDEIYQILGTTYAEGREASHESFINAVHPLDRDRVATVIRDALADGNGFSFDCRIVIADGRERSIHSEALINRDNEGRPTETVGYIQDITERKEAEAKIHHLAYHDNLTGLPNRILFEEHFNHAVALAKRTRTLLGILFLDLDRFKQINDTLGHAVGDELLREVAGRLVASIRSYDCVSRDATEGVEATVARFAGDEFLVLLENINEFYDAAKVAQRIKDGLSVPYTINGTEIIVTPSIGISLYPADGKALDDLIKCADIAMYQAKEMGRNNFQFYAQSVNSDAKAHLILESRLRKALVQDEMFICFQPVIDVARNIISGAEALVRWSNPEMGILSPAHFIPLAEETGLITEIDEWVLLNACRQLKAWQDAGLARFIVSVNVSGRHFKKRSLVETIEKTLADSHLDPTYLKLEITEGVLMNNDSYTVSTLNRLKHMGIRLAIDDFGTGYSSLSYLKRFPLDILKIDRSFIKDILEDQESSSITSAIIAMSASLKLDVVAEGVETLEQMEMLREMGCRKIQGYYFSKPLPAREFESFFRSFRQA